MNCDCSLDGDIGGFAVVARAEVSESFVFHLVGFVAVGIESSAAEGFVQSWAKGFGGHILG